MRRKSHHTLGRYLISQYLDNVPFHYKHAFLIGCVEPDLNPTTYLKGSIRRHWLRGHNYLNARRFMRTIAWRLEAKERLTLWDYYTLGKLIHYTADAFTSAHNDSFSTVLQEHRKYETTLQNYFLLHINENPQVHTRPAGTIMEVISSYHREYDKQPANIQTDTNYALAACSCILVLLFSKPII